MALAALDGFTVGVTADRRAEEQIALLTRRGATAVHAPTIRTLPLAHDDGLRAATEAVIGDPPAIVVLTTGLGTRGWLAAAEALDLDEPLLEALSGARIFARGPKAAGAALTVGLRVTWRAPSERSAEVVAELVRAGVDGVRIAVQRDGDERPLVAEHLAAHGAEVIDVPVYRWTLPPDPCPVDRLVDDACTGRLDAITFTSSPALSNLLALADRTGRREQLVEALCGRIAAVCVGPVCAERAAAEGIRAPVVPKTARLGAMVHALVRHFEGRAVELRLAGHDVVLQGSLVLVGTERNTLSRREREVLVLLAERPGVPVAKDTIAARVWGPGGDPHSVEVTVARLRRRLGPAGDGLRAVPRRGYALFG